MSAYVRGFGAITALGASARDTWRQLLLGSRGVPEDLSRSLNKRSHQYLPVPSKYIAEIGRLPRLRRSGNLSLYAIAAARDALAEAGFEPGAKLGKRFAIVYAICSGGVNHTRRFFSEIVESGPLSASPLLFPETVFNAPASHLAAILGIDGGSYTLVGDSSIGLSAIHFASQLLATESRLEGCIVVGTEECDWVLSEAFHAWRMVASFSRLELYGQGRGTILSEGAGALVLGREGRLALDARPGAPYFARTGAASSLTRVITSSKANPDLIISSANGTFVDQVEAHVLNKLFPEVPVYAPRAALGDALGAGAIWQTAFAALVLFESEAPGTLAAGPSLPAVRRISGPFRARSVLVTSVGFNQQANALVLTDSAAQADG